MRSGLARAQPEAAAEPQSDSRWAGASERRWLRYLHYLVPAAVGFVLGSRYLRDADVFWHLMLGRAVLQHGSRTVPEPTAALAWTEPCLVKDWLWDVGCYALYRAGGFGLLGLLPSVFGALIAYLTARLIALASGGKPRPLHTCLVVLAVCAASEIFDARPNLVLLAMIPACLELSLRYLDSDEPRRRRQLAAALVALQVLWAQLHSSFVLGLALFGCVAFEQLVRTPALARERRSELGVLLLGLLLATTTSAAGLSVAQLVSSHAGGDATRHITDMKPFDWSEFSLSWQTGSRSITRARRCAPISPPGSSPTRVDAGAVVRASSRGRATTRPDPRGAPRVGAEHVTERGGARVLRTRRRRGLRRSPPAARSRARSPRAVVG